MLYGRSGTGKTTLAASWPKPVLLLDVSDKGDDSISDMAGKGVKVMDVLNFDMFEDAYWYLTDHAGKFKTLIVDTASQLQQLLIQRISGGGDKSGHWGSMSMRQWGDVSAQLKGWITRLRDLPMNVVFIAQDRVFGAGDEDDADRNIIQPEVGPALSPSIAKHLNASVHVIGHTFIRRKLGKLPLGSKGKAKRPELIQYCLRLGPDPTYVTKIRKPKSVAPPSILINPTYADIEDIIKGAS